MYNKIICLSGWKQSGKDTIADHLVNKYDGFRIACADALKEVVTQEYGINRKQMEDPKLKEKPILGMPVEAKDGFTRMLADFMTKEFRNERGGQVSEFKYSNDSFLGKTDDGYGWCQLYWTPRAIIILKGAMNRCLDPNYWTNRAIDKVKEVLKTSKMPIVTDIRYKAEIDGFKKEFGEDVVFVRVNRFKESTSKDPSERELDETEFDYYIQNTGTLEELQEQVKTLLFKIMTD